MPEATTSMIAPVDEPDLRTPSRYSVQVATMAASGHQNGFCSTAFQSQRARSIACGPICTRAPRIVTSGPMNFARILRAMAPAATREAVSRAEERPPPR
jgi:hypothetical protein